MDLARAPRRAPLSARKKGSGYENEIDSVDLPSVSKFGYLKELLEPKVRVDIDMGYPLRLKDMREPRMY
jgi:hypothetical protein